MSVRRDNQTCYCRAVYLRSHLNKDNVSGYLFSSFSLNIMYPTDGIRSQLEWNSALSTSAALPIDQYKHHRKVRYLLLLISYVNISPDRYHRHNRYPWRLLSDLVLVSNHLLGPKVNTVEKLGELRRAGVNVGMSVLGTLFFYVIILVVRMNFSHGSYEYHQSVIDNTREMVARKFILHLLQLPVSERSSIRGSHWTSCCHRFGHSQSHLPLIKRKIYNRDTTERT